MRVFFTNDLFLFVQNVSEYDQEKPQSQSADQHTAS